jgi:hypothetical protein
MSFISSHADELIAAVAGAILLAVLLYVGTRGKPA